jgi:hypothetical protein
MVDHYGVMTRTRVIWVAAILLVLGIGSILASSFAILYGTSEEWVEFKPPVSRPPFAREIPGVRYYYRWFKAVLTSPTWAEVCGGVGIPIASIAGMILVICCTPSTRLYRNRPHRFESRTWMPYRLKEAADVVIKIYTRPGQLVRTLELGHKNAGSYTRRDTAAYWDGKNEVGEYVSAGVYFYTMQAGNFRATERMVKK